MAEALQNVVGVLTVCAIAIPLAGFQFKLVVSYVIYVVICVCSGGYWLWNHNPFTTYSTFRIDHIGHCFFAIDGVKHSSRIVSVIHHFSVRIGDGLHTIPAVVNKTCFERIAVGFVGQHESAVLFRHLAQFPVLVCAEAGSVLQQGDSATAVVGCRAVTIGVPHIVLWINGIDDRIQTIVTVIVIDGLTCIGQHLCRMLDHIPCAIVQIGVRTRIRMHALSHPPKHIVGVGGGVSARISTLQQLPQWVVCEGGHSAHRGDGLHLLLPRTCQSGNGNAVGVSGGRAEICPAAVCAEAV